MQVSHFKKSRQTGVVFKMTYDACDFDLINKHVWHLHRGGRGKLYARNSKLVYMHKLLLEASKGKVVDHINGNGLDNRRENLRVCTQKENLLNSDVMKRTGKYRGVSFDKAKSKWRARIGKKWVGYASTEDSAYELILAFVNKNKLQEYYK